MRSKSISRLTLALVISLALPATSHAEIEVKRLSPQLQIENGVRALATSAEVIALAGEKITVIPKGATDIASAITLTGSSVRLFTDLIEHQGRFFAVGIAESSTAASITTPPNLINPDSITIGGSSSQSKGLTRLVLLEFATTGAIIKESIFDADRPLLPRSLRIFGDRIGIVGSIASTKGVQGFLATSDISGNYLSFSTFGDASTEINSLANLRTLYGGSSERLAGSNRQGISDGVILYIDAEGGLSRVVRSFLASSERSWDEVSTAHLAVGPVKRAGNEEVAITKFSPSGTPQWFVRYPGIDPHLHQRTVAFIATKKLAGITRIAPSGKNVVFLEYDAKSLSKKATIKSVRSIPARSIVDLTDGYAIIVDREGRSQLIPLAP